MKQQAKEKGQTGVAQRFERLLEQAPGIDTRTFQLELNEDEDHVLSPLADAPKPSLFGFVFSTSHPPLFWPIFRSL